MSGPFMHRATIEQCQKLLKQIGVPVSVGSLKENMEPDLGDSHGWDFSKSNSGSLLEKIESQYETIKELIKSCKKDFSAIDRDAFNKAVRFLCHYTEDAHTIGQISAAFWGRIDNRIDSRSEFVSRKKKYSVSLPEYNSKPEIHDALYQSMKSVYDKYHSKAGGNWFLLSRSIKQMARNAVKCGAMFAAAYVWLALKEA